MSSPEPPLWRRAFDAVESAVAPPLERGTTSSEFATGAVLAASLRRTVGQRVDAVGSWALHLLALPSHADVRRVQRQLANVERELGALRRDLDRRPDDRPQQ